MLTLDEVFPVSTAAFIATEAVIVSVGSAAAAAAGSPDTDSVTESVAAAAGSKSGAAIGSPDTDSVTESAASAAGSKSGAAIGSPDTVASSSAAAGSSIAAAASSAVSAGTEAESSVTAVISSETLISGSRTRISYLNSVGFWLISLDMLSEIRPAPADLAVMNPSSSISMISGVSLLQTERAGNSSPCSMRAVSCRVSPTDMLYFAASSSCPASLLIALRTVSFSSLTDTDILAGTGSPDSDPASVSAAKA